MNKAIIIIIMIFISDIVLSQKVTQGIYDFKLLNWEFVDSVKVNSAQSNSMIKGLKETLEQSVAFNEDYLCLMKKDSFGDIIRRSVFNRNDSLIYTFFYMFDSKMYKVDKTSDTLETDLNDLIKIENIIENYDTISGLICDKITGSLENNENFEALVTKQIKIDSVNNHILPFNFFKGTTVRFTSILEGVRLTYGMNNFSVEKLDKRLFSISTDGYELMSKVLDELNHRNYEVPNNPKKGKGNGTNLGIFKKMIKSEIIEENEYVKNLIDNNIDVDKISILVDLKDMLKTLNNDELTMFLAVFDIYSERTKEFDTKYYLKKDSIKNDLYLNAILLTTLKEHLNSTKNRSILVKNLKANDYSIKSIDKDNFINGNQCLYDFLLNLTIFKELPNIEHRFSFEDKINTIKLFFQKVLGEEFDNMQFYSDSTGTFYVLINNINYKIPIEKIRNISVDNNSENTESYQKDFFKIILNVVKQIAADNDLKEIFNIYSFKDMFKSVISSKDYSLVINEFPELRIFKKPYALIKCKRDFGLKNSGEIGFSFFTKSDVEYKQLSCKSFCRSSDMAIDYAKTKIKTRFIDYISKTNERYSFNNNEFESFKENLLDTLVRYRHWIMDYVPDLVYKFDMFFGKKIKELPSEPNSFKSSFPKLYRFLRGDFQANDFKFEDSEKKKIIFRYKEKIISVKAEETDLLKKAMFLLKKNKNFTKKIYKKYGFLIYKMRYYYLTLEEKKEFQDILDFRMTPVFKHW